MSDEALEASAKGSNFIGLLSALEKRDPGLRERALALMPHECSEALKYGHVIAMGWYPVGWYRELHTAVDAVVHGGPAFARKLGHDATFSDFTGIHRAIASMLKVETVVGQSHRLLGLYWRGGTVERLELSPGRARIRMANWRGFSRLVWEDLMGGIEAVMEICGANAIRCKSVGTHEAADDVEFDVRWG